MVKYKEILWLLHGGYSRRKSKETCIIQTLDPRVSRCCKTSNLPWPLDESVTNEQIEAILISGAVLRS